MNKNAMMAVAVAVVAVVAIAAALVLTSGDKGESCDTETVTVNAYNMSYIVTDQNDPRYPEPVKDVSEYLMGEYTFLVKKGQGEVLYTTLDDFARLFDDDLMAGYHSTVDRDGKKFTWTFTDDKGGEMYRYVFDAGEMTMSENGDDDVLVSDNNRSSVIDQLQLDEVKVVDTGLPNTYSFEGYGLDPIVKGGKTYFPLGFLDSSTQLELSRNFIYSEEDGMLFKYGDATQMDAPFIRGSDDEATINKVVAASYARYSDPDGTIYPPVYMLEFTRDLFYFLMDNFYDLNEVTGYRCMSDFFKNNTYSDGLVSQDPAVRGEAYTVLIGLLNDLHSGYSGSVVLGEMPAYNPGNEIQDLLNDRTTLYLQLMEQRAAAVKAYGADSPTDVRYSSDGTTAYFSFDEFSAVTHYDDQPLTPEQREKDTYFFFVDKLNEIKAHGGVERVVIDDSCNGGGIVVIMGKLLALMSKDNHAVSYERNGITGDICEYSYRVDSNGDGVYDEKDCFGNDFRFYIHTSLYSYSSGNAFPFYAKALGIAETIGSKSGGGECTAVYNILPFGHKINHSSFKHLGYYDEATQTYHGDEHGQPADVFLGVHQFDVDKVSIVLKDHESKGSSRPQPPSRPEAMCRRPGKTLSLILLAYPVQLFLQCLRRLQHGDSDHHQDYADDVGHVEMVPERQHAAYGGDDQAGRDDDGHSGWVHAADAVDDQVVGRQGAGQAHDDYADGDEGVRGYGPPQEAEVGERGGQYGAEQEEVEHGGVLGESPLPHELAPEGERGQGYPREQSDRDPAYLDARRVVGDPDDEQAADERQHHGQDLPLRYPVAEQEECEHQDEVGAGHLQDRGHLQGQGLLGLEHADVRCHVEEAEQREHPQVPQPDLER